MKKTKWKTNIYCKYEINAHKHKIVPCWEVVVWTLCSTLWYENRMILDMFYLFFCFLFFVFCFFFYLWVYFFNYIKVHTNARINLVHLVTLDCTFACKHDKQLCSIKGLPTLLPDLKKYNLRFTHTCPTIDRLGIYAVIEIVYIIEVSANDVNNSKDINVILYFA